MRSRLLLAGLFTAASIHGCGRVGFDRQALLDGGGDAAFDAPRDSTRDTSLPSDAAADALDAAEDAAEDAATPQLITAISSGLSHSCVIAEGAAYCWGSGSSGQLGDGTTADAPTPVAVAGLPGTPSLLDCGHFHTCAVVEGVAYCWGQGGAGELGDGMARDSATPVEVIELPGRVTSISGGQDFTCAVSAGRALCWGVDRQGSLGRMAVGNSDSPVLVEIDADMREISAGQDHACAVTADGSTAYCWGHNDGGALGNSSASSTERTPVQVQLPPEVTRIVDISIGGWHTCARTDLGVYCWGTGTRGELGDGRMTSTSVPVLVTPFSTGASTKHLTVNGNPTFLDATCVVAAEGAVHCWGVNSTGRMGDGTTMDRAVPTVAMGVSAILVATGVDHTCAADAAGEVTCWGAGGLGQLGDGRSTDSLVAVDVLAPW